jgi:hypothetical protein
MMTQVHGAIFIFYKIRKIMYLCTSESQYDPSGNNRFLETIVG